MANKQLATDGRRRKGARVLTARSVASIKPGEWLTAPASQGQGALQARGLASGGVTYYLRVSVPGKGQQRVKVGTNIRFADARKFAAELSLRYQHGEHDLQAALQREADTERANVDAAIQADADKRTRTLGALLEAYTEQLEHDHKRSYRDARNGFRLLVRDAFPDTWNMPLDDVDAHTLLTVISAPVAAGKLRQGDILRQYMRAAFSAGIKAEFNAKALPCLRDLRVSDNPAAALLAIDGAMKARDRALELGELRAYWRRIQGPANAALRFHLLTGAQRIKQLARATTSDYDVDTQALRLLDTKGRRSTPRKHWVPMLPDALAAVQDMRAGEQGPYMFTVTAGRSGADYGGLRKRLSVVVDAMEQAGELEKERFTLGDLRRTVETHLADADISRETRAHLQSHGLGGVQARHYDRADYLPKTRAALETLHRLMIGTVANAEDTNEARA